MSTSPRSTVARRHVFGRGSPVLEYWLGHSKGFRLATSRGGNRGVVEQVVVDESGHPRSLVVRSAVLQRAQVLDVSSVEAVVPSDRTITLRGDGHRPRDTGATARRAAGRAAPLVMKATLVVAGTALAALVLLASAVRWGGRRARTYAPVVARRAWLAAAGAAAWARPHAGTLARLTAAAVVAGVLLLVTLAQALLIGAAASVRLVAREWRKRRAAARRGRPRQSW